MYYASTFGSFFMSPLRSAKRFDVLVGPATFASLIVAKGVDGRVDIDARHERANRVHMFTLHSFFHSSSTI